jgi:hypothetical protein
LKKGNTWKGVMVNKTGNKDHQMSGFKKLKKSGYGMVATSKIVGMSFMIIFIETDCLLVS